MCDFDCIVGSPAKTNIKSLQDHFKLSDPQLDRLIERTELLAVGMFFDNWMFYTGPLGLDEGEKQTILADHNLTSSAMRMERVLMLWQDNDQLAATFRNLLSIVVSHNKGNVALKIYKYLGKA